MHMYMGKGSSDNNNNSYNSYNDYCYIDSDGYSSKNNSKRGGGNDTFLQVLSNPAKILLGDPKQLREMEVNRQIHYFDDKFEFFYQGPRC